MPTTVFFATNRIVSNPSDWVNGYPTTTVRSQQIPWRSRTERRLLMGSM